MIDATGADICCDCDAKLLRYGYRKHDNEFMRSHVRLPGIKEGGGHPAKAPFFSYFMPHNLHTVIIIF